MEFRVPNHVYTKAFILFSSEILVYFLKVSFEAMIVQNVMQHLTSVTKHKLSQEVKGYDYQGLL